MLCKKSLISFLGAKVQNLKGTRGRNFMMQIFKKYFYWEGNGQMWYFKPLNGLLWS